MPKLLKILLVGVIALSAILSVGATLTPASADTNTCTIPACLRIGQQLQYQQCSRIWGYKRFLSLGSLGSIDLCRLQTRPVPPAPQPSADCNLAMPFANVPPVADDPTTPRVDEGSISIQWAEYATVCLINQERARLNLDRVDIDSRLAGAARDHAKDIVAHDPADRHAGLIGRVTASGYPFSREGEIVMSARAEDGGPYCQGSNGQIDTTPQEMIEAWRCSSGHWNKITDPGFKHVGLGVAIGYAPDRVCRPDPQCEKSDAAVGSERTPPATFVGVFATPLGN